MVCLCIPDNKSTFKSNISLRTHTYTNLTIPSPQECVICSDRTKHHRPHQPHLEQKHVSTVAIWFRNTPCSKGNDMWSYVEQLNRHFKLTHEGSSHFESPTSCPISHRGYFSPWVLLEIKQAEAGRVMSVCFMSHTI